MLDFVMVDDHRFVKDTRIINPKFVIKVPPKDLMIKGGEIYGIWDEDTKLWVTDENAIDYIIKTVDRDLDICAEDYRKNGGVVAVNYMWDADSKAMDRFLKYVKRQMPPNCFHVLDDKLVFANQETKRDDYASKKLPYSLKEGDFSAYDELIGTLYDEENRRKIEWAIGSIVEGASKRIQKFVVLYGEAGSGKSTILNIIQWLFEGYWKTFDAKALAQSNNDFALESFKTNPLVAIQHDGDLSKIEDNTKLNSLVSHEVIEINAKFEKKYAMSFHSFIFMGTNSPVKITNAKSGLIRRLIDVRPSGKKLPKRKYNELMGKIKFELGAIASHCLDVFKEMGENYYDDYIPIEMMAATNDFYDFVEHNYEHYKEENMVTLAEAWKSYSEYCDFANAYKLSYRIFRTELRNYFETFSPDITINGKRVRSVYTGFRTDKFELKKGEKKEKKEEALADTSWLIFEDPKEVTSFDKIAWEWPAQLEVDYGKGEQPEKAWKSVTTMLCDIDQSKTHYVNPPIDIPIIMIDFDLKNDKGEKDLEINVKAASKFPKTYAELSKSGNGIHLYYFFDGFDLNDLSTIYSPGIEIKIFNKEGSAIRRKLTKCNDILIMTLTGGLPKKGVKKTGNWKGIENEKMLRTMIKKNLNKEYHADTSSSINYINSLLNEAYESGLPYNVSNMRSQILSFAMGSTNQADRCCAVVNQMKFKSDESEDIDYSNYFTHISFVKNKDPNNPQILVLDLEVYRPGNDISGYFLVCWKVLGTKMIPSNVVAMENPKPHEIQELIDKFEMMGHNILEYDCYMLYAASRGDSVAQLYDLSYDIVNLNRKESKIYEAKKMVYCDTYEYTKAAGDGKGLKKWEIELSGLSRYSDDELRKKGYSDDQIKAIAVFRDQVTHKEMEIPWDMPAPLDKREEIKKYCINDVLACEAVYWFTQNYFKARLFQVDLVKALHGGKILAFPRDTANSLSKKTIFGGDKNPQVQFNYRDLSKPVGSEKYAEYRQYFGDDYIFRVWNDKGLPEYREYRQGEVLPDGWSILPFFPGYIFDKYQPKGKKSFFMDDYGGEGGRIYSKKGMYLNVLDLDISSQYPHSIMAEMLFGPKYTKIFSDIVKARVAVKHKDFEAAGKLLNGALKPYLKEETAKDLAQALKIIINSIYGLTTASFPNEFRDERNLDNIVAKRGNLFMRVLQLEIEKKGYEVCHIKTDSIKIVGADRYIHEFVVKFAKEYGYNFEVEADFSKFVLLNDAAYVGRLKDGSWMFKADEFKPAFVRKMLFTHEPLVFDDYCLTFATKDALYLDLNEGNEPDGNDEKRYKYLTRKILKEEIPKGCRSLEDAERELAELDAKLRACHSYRFVGKVGQFTPVVKGAGGGGLYRGNGKDFASVGGSKGYLWLESYEVKRNHLEDKIDLEYFRAMADRAKDDISALPNANFEWLVSDEDFINIPEGINQEVPFDE